ncbi:MAG: cytochrome c oxidase subunit 3 [Limisphaerales bacterium]|jgi:cytochrome c oxidase subunit 3
MDRKTNTGIETKQGSFTPSPESAGLVMVYLVLGGISVLFVTLTFAYVFGDQHAIWAEFILPKWFWISTLISGLASFFLHRAMQSYEQDDASDLRKFLSAAVLMGGGFVLTQFAAWNNMAGMGIKLSGTPSGSYLYVISGLHAAHVAVGIVFLLFSLNTVFKFTQDKVSALIFFSDPNRKNRLKMSFIYWHTVGALWLYIFLFFLYNHSYPGY